MTITVKTDIPINDNNNNKRTITIKRDIPINDNNNKKRYTH
jgi:hypothetical protein